MTGNTNKKAAVGSNHDGTTGDDVTIRQHPGSAIPLAVKNANPNRQFMVADLAKSGIGEEVANRLGIVPSKDGYLLPYRDPETGQPMLTPDGQPFTRTRFAKPKKYPGETKPRKYLTPVGGGTHAYILPEVHQHLVGDKDAWLVVTEGEKKSVAATLAGHPTIGIPGIPCWRESKATRGHDGEMLAELRRYLPRTCLLVYDSDAIRDGSMRPDFASNSRAFARELARLGSTLYVMTLPPAADGRKQGLDDIIVANGPDAFGDLVADRAFDLVAPYHSEVSADELAAITFPPVGWVIPTLLPEGLALLVGKSKLGKSWLALGIGVAVASAGTALCKWPVEGGDVLYVSLEDTQRRLQDRLARIFEDGEPRPSRLHFWTELPGTSFAANCAELAAWLQFHPEARLIIIDTLGRFLPPRRSGGDAYSDDTASLATLHTLAKRHHAAIVLVHHCRKMESDDPFDMVLGSSALMGVADTTIVLKRARNGADAEMHVTGRDVHEQELALSFNDGLWRLEGDLAEAKATDIQRTIMQALAKGGMSAAEVAMVTGMTRPNVYQHLDRMVNKQIVRKVGTRFELEK